MAGTYIVGDKTKAAILKGSRKLFYKNGYKDTTYNDISTYLNINRALIPYHFNNKLALAVAVYNEIISTSRNEADELLDINELSDDLASAFNLIIFYRLFANKHLVEFVSDLISENSDILYDIDQEKAILSGLNEAYSKMDDTTIDLISNSMAAIRFRLISCLKENLLSPDDMARHYIDFALRYAGVSAEDIKELTDSAFQLADLITCEVKQNFQVAVSYR